MRKALISLFLVLFLTECITLYAQNQSSGEIIRTITSRKWFLRRYETEDQFYTVPKPYQGTYMRMLTGGKLYYYKNGENENIKPRYDWQLSGNKKINLTAHNGDKKTFALELKSYVGGQLRLTQTSGDEKGLSYVWEDAGAIEEAEPAVNRNEGSKGASGSSRENLFTESFNSNLNRWLEGEDASYKFKVDNGVYTLESKKGGYWQSYKAIDIHSNAQADFEISTRIKKVAGTDGYYFGLLLGYSATSKYYHLAGITGQGNAVFADKGSDGKDLIGGNITSAVNKGNTTNELVIRKIQNTLYFYVNGELLGTTSYRAFYGNNFGFALWSGNEYLKLEIEDFNISLLN